MFLGLSERDSGETEGTTNPARKRALAQSPGDLSNLTLKRKAAQRRKDHLFGSSYELLYLAGEAGTTWSRPCDSAIVANSSGERKSHRDDTLQVIIKHQHICISNIHPQSQLSTAGCGYGHALARPTIQIK